MQERKGGKHPAAALGCPTGKEQPGSSGTHRKDKGQLGTGTRCSKGKMIHPEHDQTLHPEHKGDEKCPVRCSKLSSTGPEPGGITLKAVQLWSRALQVLSKPSSSAMLIFLPNLSSPQFRYQQLNKQPKEVRGAGRGHRALPGPGPQPPNQTQRGMFAIPPEPQDRQCSELPLLPAELHKQDVVIL